MQLLLFLYHQFVYVVCVPSHKIPKDTIMLHKYFCTIQPIAQDTKWKPNEFMQRMNEWQKYQGHQQLRQQPHGRPWEEIWDTLIQLAPGVPALGKGRLN